MIWQPFFFFNTPFLRSHFDRLVLRVKMSNFNWLCDIDFYPVGLLCVKIRVKSLILRKLPKWSKNCIFENFKKYSPKVQVKSYSEKVLIIIIIINSKFKLYSTTCSTSIKLCTIGPHLGTFFWISLLNVLFWLNFCWSSLHLYHHNSL